MNPRPNHRLKLIDSFIRNKMEVDLGIKSHDTVTQENLLMKMISTNEKTIGDWVYWLEKLRYLKALIT